MSEIMSEILSMTHSTIEHYSVAMQKNGVIIPEGKCQAWAQACSSAIATRSYMKPTKNNLKGTTAFMLG